MTRINACPCCGAPRSPRALKFDEEFAVAIFGERTAALSRQRFRALELLHAALPRPAYAWWLAESLGISRGQLRKTIRILRAEIKPLGLIVTNSKSGHYLLETSSLRRDESDRRAAPGAPRPRFVCA